MKNIISKFIVTVLICFGTFDPAAQEVAQEWVKTYSYLGNGENKVQGVITDGNGNIFVTGSSDGSNERDYCTVKYLPNGSYQWAARYGGFQGPENFDVPYDITRDYNNNIYVTGSSLNEGFSECDIATIKYNQNGEEVWVRRYSSAGSEYDEGYAIHVDNAYNVYVTGNSDDNLVVIKYNSSGTELWKTIHPNPVNYWSTGFDITVDGLGNVYAAGAQFFSSTGKAVLIKLSPSGNLIWERIYNSGLSNGFMKIERDLQGNIIVGGYSGTQGAYNIVTEKYAPDGEKIWSKEYNSPNNGHESMYDMKVDYSNNVILTGSTTVNSNTSILTIKYASNGNELWKTTYNNPSNLTDIAYGLTFDGQGNTYITGFTRLQASPLKDDIITIKYNNLGQSQWIKMYDSPGGNSEQGISITLDNSNNIIVAGELLSAVNLSYCTIKYSPVNGIQILGGETPVKYELSQNYPNPFNPVTNINFSLPKSSNVRLIVFDIMGQQVAELVNEDLQAGSYKFDFDASRLSSGTYFYKLSAGDFSEVKKMMLVK